MCACARAIEGVELWTGTRRGAKKGQGEAQTDRTNASLSKNVYVCILTRDSCGVADETRPRATFVIDISQDELETTVGSRKYPGPHQDAVLF